MTTRAKFPFAISGVSPKRLATASRKTSCASILFAFLFFDELTDARWSAFVHRQAMIDEFDLDQDGEINEQEFINIMTDEA